jgi:hypothetical protein
MYEQGIALMRSRGSTTARERIRSIVIIDVTEAASLISPAYYDGTSEDVIAERWLRRVTELRSGERSVNQPDGR